MGSQCWAGYSFRGKSTVKVMPILFIFKIISFYCVEGIGGDKRTDGFQDPREFSLSMVARWLSWKWETGVLEILVLSSSAATASLLSPTFPFFSTSIHLSVHLYMLPKPISLFFFSLLFSENYAKFRHPIWNVERGFSKSP